MPQIIYLQLTQDNHLHLGPLSSQQQIHLPACNHSVLLQNPISFHPQTTQLTASSKGTHILMCNSFPLHPDKFFFKVSTPFIPPLHFCRLCSPTPNHTISSPEPFRFPKSKALGFLRASQKAHTNKLK